MHMDAPGEQARNAQQLHVEESGAPTIKAIDVSTAAVAVLLFGKVLMDAEAFGVTVSRRPGAEGTNLTSYERGRLLDVLCHAQAFQRTCSTQQEANFPVWIVSSDARDAQPRAQWLVMSMQEDGSYLIRLSDL